MARARTHPFAADAQQVRETLTHAGLPEGLSATESGTIVARLPSRADGPLPSPDMAGGAESPSAEAPSLAAWRITALTLEGAQAAGLLLALADAPEAPRPSQDVLGDDLRFWVAATRFALALLARQRLLSIAGRECTSHHRG